jgi:hypothetical protein
LEDGSIVVKRVSRKFAILGITGNVPCSWDVDIFSAFYILSVLHLEKTNFNRIQFTSCFCFWLWGDWLTAPQPIKLQLYQFWNEHTLTAEILCYNFYRLLAEHGVELRARLHI